MSHADWLETLTDAGAHLDARGRPLHFGDAAAELVAALDGVVVADRSSLGRLRGNGPDLLSLLDRLTTNRVRDLAPGTGLPTVLTTAKGRIVDRLLVHHLGEGGVLLVTGEGAEARVESHLGRYTIGEDTGLHNVSAGTRQFVVVGPRGSDALGETGWSAPSRFGAARISCGDGEAYLLGDDGTGGEGFAIVVDALGARDAWRHLAAATARAGGRVAGDAALESRRILLGLPAAGAELTEEHNPLEAGLVDAVRFDKGCYVGQEVIARLRTYDKVSRSLVGWILPAGALAPAPGSPLSVAGQEVGKVTSVGLLPQSGRVIGMAYVKPRDLGEATTVTIGESATARLTPLPFPSDSWH